MQIDIVEVLSLGENWVVKKTITRFRTNRCVYCSIKVQGAATTVLVFFDLT